MAEMDELLASLSEQRAALIRNFELLSDAQAMSVVVSSGWSALDMAHHVARVERYWVDAIMRGDDGEFGTQDVTGSWAWATPVGLSYESAIANYRRGAAKSDEYIADLASLDDAPACQPAWETIRHWSRSMRTVILHLIDETARHAGHMDVHCEVLLSRES